MKSKMLPLVEKVKIITFLQSKVPQGGNFTFTYLKTHNQYQITLLNRKDGSAIKHRADKIEDCFSIACQQLEREYYEHNRCEFWIEYDKSRENELLKQKLIETNEMLNSLQVKYDNLLSSVKMRPRFVNHTKTPESAEEYKERLKNLREENRQAENEESSPKPLKKRKRRESKLFTNEQIDTEVFRKLKGVSVSIKPTKPGQSPRSEAIKTMNDLKAWSRLCPEGYRLHRNRAYKRLMNNRTRDRKKKVNRLNIKENKYGITKTHIIQDMKRVLGLKFQKLNSTLFLKEWRKAKNRVWNRHSINRNGK